MPSVSPPAPFKAFTLALIQLGNIGSNKAENLRHAREMILRAASGQGRSKRPDLIVLPVRLFSLSLIFAVLFL
jgi:omega-amidase